MTAWLRALWRRLWKLIDSAFNDPPEDGDVSGWGTGR